MQDHQALDRIHIRDINVRCIVGINDWERKRRQEVAISTTLYLDLSTAGRSDRVEDTVDYKALKNDILRTIEDSRFYLIERIAETVADLCLERSAVQRVDVIVDKLTALRFARSVAVEITRTKSDD